MKKELILQVQHGGLGDHLFYSHLPRIAKESGLYDRVLVSNKSDFRNKDYKMLVWDSNPFIDGFTDLPGSERAEIALISEDRNLLDCIMLAYGLDDGKHFHEPEIYYKPRLIESLADKTIYDPNYISNAGFVTAPKVNSYFAATNTHIDYQMRLVGEHAIPLFKFDGLLAAKSFIDFVDIIYSAKHIYCLVTGTATLAPALGKSATIFYTKDQDPVFRHSKLNTYIQL
jgi:hypothetical protein